MKTKPILLAVSLAMVAGTTYAMPPYEGHNGKAWMLERFDTDDDGQLSKAEMDRARGERFAKFDSNGDGVLTLQEFKEGKMRVHEERMTRHFNKLDANGDGQVSAEEFAAPAAKRFGRADSNGDGVITADEMSGMHHKHHMPE